MVHQMYYQGCRYRSSFRCHQYPGRSMQKFLRMRWSSRRAGWLNLLPATSKHTLVKTMKSEGPAAAIGVCNVAAPEIASKKICRFRLESWPNINQTAQQYQCT